NNVPPTISRFSPSPFLLLFIRRSPKSTLFPYATLFRSRQVPDKRKYKDCILIRHHQTKIPIDVGRHTALSTFNHHTYPGKSYPGFVLHRTLHFLFHQASVHHFSLIPFDSFWPLNSFIDGLRLKEAG